jgi:hypothetical protein
MVAITRVAVRIAVAGSVPGSCESRRAPSQSATTRSRNSPSITAEQAGDFVGFLGRFWGADGPASAQTTRDLLGWQPTRPGLIADLNAGHYFA